MLEHDLKNTTLVSFEITDFEHKILQYVYYTLLKYNYEILFMRDEGIKYSYHEYPFSSLKNVYSANCPISICVRAFFNYVKKDKCM